MANFTQVATSVLALLACASCSPCGNERLRVSLSPSGSVKAVVFDRNCGATTGYSTQVSVVPASSSEPTDSGNALILGDSQELSLHWESNDRLIISGLGDVKTFKEEPRVNGVTLVYRN